jgi:diacylglycerol O-acyltransferase
VSRLEWLSQHDHELLAMEERSNCHMHVALVLLFRGRAPSYNALAELVETRLPLVPRYRQVVVPVPFGQGRSVWVDDAHFNLYYHLRLTALPAPANERTLEEFVGEVFSQRLVRSRPLWELWLVEKLTRNRFALIAKAHHVLVDGQGGQDLTTVLLDRSAADGHLPQVERRPDVRPQPGPIKLLGEAWLERLRGPLKTVADPHRLRELPREVATKALRDAAESGLQLLEALRSPAPPTPFNVAIGPHRRCRFLAVELELLRRIKSSLGGTVNDAILAAISLGLGEYLREHGHDTEGLKLRVLVPVSLRTPGGEGSSELGSMRVALPVGVTDPLAAHKEIAAVTRQEARRVQAISARRLTTLAGFAQPTILSQAARLQAGYRYANLVVTNVPGPQLPLYLMGRELLCAYPLLPLPANHALGISLMSYKGRACFGFNADYDAITDLERIGTLIDRALGRLAKAAGVGGQRRHRAAAA